jgi:predicted ribosomally synthesized peptide with SipW-like signal peptide
MNQKFRSVLGSIFVMGVTILLMGTATQSYFSDTETSQWNTFTAGTIDLSVDGENAWTRAEYEITGGDAKPCETFYDTQTLKNVGQNPMDVWKRISTVVNDENGVPEPELAYYAAHQGSDTWKISDWIHYDMCVTPATEYSYEGNILGLGVEVEDTGDGWLLWTYTYAEHPSNTPKMTVAIDYPNGFAITTFDDGSHDGWYYAPDPDIEATRIRLGDYSGYDGTTIGYEWVQTTAVGNVLTVKILKSELGDSFHWHGYGNYEFTGVWINADETGSGYGDPPFEVTLKLLEILETDGYFLTADGPHLPTQTPNEGGVKDYWIYLGVLLPEESMIVTQSYHLDATVDNWGQSDQVSFTIEYYAQQTVGGALPPGPQLSGHAKP